jgi:tetratricopeptide (TPR) repeat protein
VKNRSRKSSSDDRLFSWQFLVGVVAVTLLVVYWPKPLEFLAELGSIESEPEEVADIPAPVETPGFETQLYDALGLSRTGSRDQAHELFQRLLEETTDPVEKAALLPRAADFYMNGAELSSREIERLYQDALQTFGQVYSNNYYDYENVHRGLEKLYISQKRYADAAVQTTFILAFYRRHYQEDNTRYLFEKPSTIRLGNHLMSAGQPDEARRVYQGALDMTIARGESTYTIDAIITNIDRPEGNKQDVFEMRLVAPPGLPPYPVYKNDVRPRIEAIEIDGLTVERITENLGHFRIQRYAVDNTIVAAYLRELQESVGKPNLQVVSQREQDGRVVSAFSITVNK